MSILNKQLINFDTSFDKIWDKPIYRVFSLEKFLTSLNENVLFLVKTKCWEDPYEAFLQKQLVWKDDGSENYPFAEHLVENFYGQCWTFLKESNFLWKIYAPNNDGIIVKSSLKKLYDLFVDNPSDYGDFFLGKIKYWEEGRIKKFFQAKRNVEELLSDKGAIFFLKSFFVKRVEFKEEQEVRLIYYSRSAYGAGMNVTKNGFTFEKRHLFNDLADELILDPRIDPIRQDSISNLIKKLGYTGPINKSNLFDIPILSLRVK